jgi:hypothetical protein
MPGRTVRLIDDRRVPDGHAVTGVGWLPGPRALWAIEGTIEYHPTAHGKPTDDRGSAAPQGHPP